VVAWGKAMYRPVPLFVNVLRLSVLAGLLLVIAFA
jgi:hypothetical protein